MPAAPDPAFTASGPLPPADPPAPPLEFVENRQPPPGVRSATPARVAAIASESPVREATPARPPAGTDSAPRIRGLALFNDYSCGACHAFADARGAGSIGPSLDRAPPLTKAFAAGVISNGRGAMPAFGGQMTEAEIDAVAEYIVRFARR